MAKRSVLFICLGNICRSPIAEAVFIDLLQRNNQTASWTVDSAALGNWHVGKGPDPRARSTLKKHGIQYSHKVRQIKESDFRNFDIIFGMDEDNMAELERRSPSDSRAELKLLGDFDPKGKKIIRDPYYDDGDEGFEECYQQCVRSCTAFLEK